MAESVSLHIKDFYKWKRKEENLQASISISYLELGIIQGSLVCLLLAFLKENIIAYEL